MTIDSTLKSTKSISTKKPLERIIFGGEGEEALTGQQMFLPIDIPPEAILPKIVEKCGDKKYWESWAKDVADIFGRLVGRVENLLENPDNEAIREWFERIPYRAEEFHKRRNHPEQRH